MNNAVLAAIFDTYDTGDKLLKTTRKLVGMHGKAFFDLRLTDLAARPAPEAESPSHEHGLRAVFIKGNNNIVVQYFLYLHSVFLSCGADRIQSLACSAHCATTRRCRRRRSSRAKPWFARKSAAVSSRWTRRSAHGASAPADCAVTLRRRQTACIACTAASPRVSRGHHDDSSGRIFRLFTRLRAR